MSVFLLPRRGYHAEYYIVKSTPRALDGAVTAVAGASADLSTSRSLDGHASVAVGTSATVTVAGPSRTALAWPDFAYHLSHYLIKYVQFDGTASAVSYVSAAKWKARAFRGSVTAVGAMSAGLATIRGLKARAGSASGVPGDLTTVRLAQYPLAAAVPTVINALYAGQPVRVSPLRIVPTPLMPADTLLPNDDVFPEG